MTDLGYLLWFVATATMTVTVLAVGTLAAADLLPRRQRTREHHRPHTLRPRSRSRTGTTGADTLNGEQQTPTPGQHRDHQHQAA